MPSLNSKLPLGLLAQQARLDVPQELVGWIRLNAGIQEGATFIRLAKLLPQPQHLPNEIGGMLERGRGTKQLGGQLISLLQLPSCDELADLGLEQGGLAGSEPGLGLS